MAEVPINLSELASSPSIRQYVWLLLALHSSGGPTLNPSRPGAGLLFLFLQLLFPVQPQSFQTSDLLVSWLLTGSTPGCLLILFSLSLPHPLPLLAWFSLEPSRCLWFCSPSCIPQSTPQPIPRSGHVLIFFHSVRYAPII